MLLKFFYMHSIATIKQQFPKLEDPFNESYVSSYCGITRGWAPPMADIANKICPIEEDRQDFFVLRDNDFLFDKRLGDILLVDTEKQDNCFFLNRDNNGYVISIHRTANTVGGITNRPPPPEYKKKNRLYAIMRSGKKGVFTHGNMAFSD